MTRLRLSTTRAMALAAMTAVAGCSGGGDDGGAEHTILIGAVVDRTGNNSEPSWGDAIALAERHMNAALKDAGFGKDLEFQIDIEDSENTPTVAVERAIDLVQQRGAKAIIADSSQNSIAINRLHYDFDATNDLFVPIQCSGCTSGSINSPTATNANPIEQAALRNGEKWLFRSLMSTKLISRIIAQLFLADGDNGDVNNDGVFKVVAYHSNEAFGNATATDLTTFVSNVPVGLHATNGDTVIIENLSHPGDADPDTYDWAADMVKITDNKTTTATTEVTDVVPDVISVASFAQYYVPFILQYNQLPEVGRPRLLNVHTFRIQSAVTALGAEADGIQGVSHVLIDGPPGDTFAADYQGYYGYAPVYRDSIYYDNAMMLMLAAFKAAYALDDPSAVTGEQVAAALRTLSAAGGTVVTPGRDGISAGLTAIVAGSEINYDGASGPIDHDANQNTVNRLAHYEAQAGSFTDLTKFDCVANTTTCPEIP